MHTNAPPTQTLADKMVEYIATTDATLTKAAAIEDRHNQSQEKVAKLIPAVVDLLVANKLVFDHQREKVAELLKTPEGAMDLLHGTLSRQKQAAEVPPLGVPVPNGGTAGYKQASAVGGRAASGSPVKDSTAAWFRGLGLDVPTNE